MTFLKLFQKLSHLQNGARCNPIPVLVGQELPDTSLTKSPKLVNPSSMVDAKEASPFNPRRIVRKTANSSIYPKFLHLTFLNILSNLTIPLAGIADTVMLGNFTNSIYIAGVSLGTVLFDYLYWGFGFLRMGTTGTTAIKTGQGDEEGVYLVLFRSLLIGLGIGISILILSPWIGGFGFSILSGTDELKSIGKSYFYHRIWDAPFTMMNLVFIGWFLGRARSDIVLLLTLTSNSLNIFLDYWFIVKLGMTADGVGIASGFAQTFQFLLGSCILFYLYRKNEIKNFLKFSEWREKIFRRSEFLQILNFNKDIFLRTLFLIVTFSMFRNFSASMGSDILTVNTILLQFMLVFAFFVDGSAFATETIAGDLYGKGEKKALDRILNLGFLFGLVVSLLFVLGLEIFPREIIGFITKDSKIIPLAEDSLIGLYPVLVIGSLAFAYDGLFLGIMQGRTLRNSMFVATFVIFLPTAGMALYLNWNLLLWMGLAGFMGGRTISLAWAKSKLNFQS